SVCPVEAEEPWARPPRASDLAGDDRERVPGLVPPHEPVLDNHHLVCLAAPGAHQSRAGFQCDLACLGPIRLIRERSREFGQMTPGGGVETAQRPFLQL